MPDIMVSGYMYKPLRLIKTEAEIFGAQNEKMPRKESYYTNLSLLPKSFEELNLELLTPNSPWNVKAEIKSFKEKTIGFGSYQVKTKRLEPALIYYGWNGKFDKPKLGTARYDAGTISLSQSNFVEQKGYEAAAVIVGAYPANLIDGASVPGGTKGVSEEIYLMDVFGEVMNGTGGMKVDERKRQRRRIDTFSDIAGSLCVGIQISENHPRLEPTYQKKLKVFEDLKADIKITDIVPVDDNFLEYHSKLGRGLFEVYQAYRTDFAQAATAKGWQGDSIERTPIIIESKHMNPGNQKEYFAYTIFQRDHSPRGGHVDKTLVVTTNFSLTEEMEEGGTSGKIFKTTETLLNELTAMVSKTHYSRVNDNSQLLLDQGVKKIQDFAASLR
jgi:hypothetical protein